MSIIAGDFNFVEASIDTLNQEKFKFTKDKKAFQILRQNHFLTDVYREKNPPKKVFTYSHPRGSTRIDRIYVNESLVPIIKKIYCFPTTQTDHVFTPIIELNIPVKTRWGSGLYHFNNTLLKNPSFKSEIENIFESWRLTKSNFENLLN